MRTEMAATTRQRLVMAGKLASLSVMFAVASLVGERPAAASYIGYVGVDTGPTETPEEQDPPAQQQPETWRFRVGLGVAVVPDYQGSDDYEVVPVPRLTAYKGPQYVDINGTYLFSNVLPSPHWRLGPTAKFIRGDRCNAEDNRVNDMRCQANAFMLGATGGYSFVIPGVAGGQARLTPALEVVGDTAGANDGVTIEPQLNFGQRLSENWRLGLRGFGTWGSGNYNDYYFGVTPIQSQDSGLSQHNADGGFYRVGLLGVVDYDMTSHWKLRLTGRYTRMVGDAEDSPLVDGNDGRGNANQFLGAVTVSYGW